MNQRGILLDRTTYDSWDEFVRLEICADVLLEAKFVKDYEVVSDCESDIQEQEDHEDFIDDDCEEVPNTQPMPEDYDYECEFTKCESKRHGDFMKKSIRIKNDVHAPKKKIVVRKRKDLTFGTSVNEPLDESSDDDKQSNE